MSDLKRNQDNIRIKKVISDFIYNIFSSFIYIGVIQIIVYPMFAKMMGANEYGLLLTTMGVVNTISMSLGSTLNNTRLIQNSKYNEYGLLGDFNLLLIIANIFGLILAVFAGNVYIKIGFDMKVLFVIMILLNITKSYFIVAYRINLDFKLNFVSNIISSTGLLLGLLLWNFTNVWPLTFIIAELFNITFLLLTTNLYKEPFKRTRLFNSTSTKYTLLIITGMLSSISVYLDRLIVYPILGGGAVAIYSVASFFGKSLGLAMNPIAGVLLGYYAQKTFKMTTRRFWRINLIVMGITVLFWGISLILSPIFTGLLYPSLIESSRPYLVLANFGSILGVATNMIDPVVLKYAPTHWQVILYVVYAFSYIGISILLMNHYFILGLCIAIITSNLIKLVFLLIIGDYYIKKGEI